MYVDAVKTSPPFGISMLSVQMSPPDSGRFQTRFALSAESWTTSPDHDIAAARSPFESGPE